ncbi:MAG: GyrI-like domain-containing protein [Chloroflexota bacterium]
MAVQENGNAGDAEVQQLEPQPVLSIRATIRIADLGPAMDDRIPALVDYLQQSGARPAGPPYVRYHTFGDTETDVETGIPVLEPIVGHGRIAAGELPGGPAVTTWHTGPHHKLGEAYARISAFIKSQGHEPNGDAWEVYHWIDPSRSFETATFDPSTWHTQLVQPIK